MAPLSSSRLGRCGAALAALLLWAPAAPASAQTPGTAAAPAAIPSVAAAAAAAPKLAQTSVVSVKMDRVLADSAAGREARRQIEQLAEKLRQEIRDREARLKDEERNIAALRSQLSEAELLALANQFQQRKWQYDEDVKISEERLDRARQAALSELRRQLLPVLEEVMTRLGAAVMLEESVIIRAAPGVDVTEEVIRAFDAVAKPFEVRLPGGD